MKKNIPDIDKIFKDALDDLHEAAPPAVWESLNSDLDRKQAALYREKYYRLRKLALLLLLVVCSGGAYLAYTLREEKKETLAMSTMPPSAVQTNDSKQPAAATASKTIPSAENQPAQTNVAPAEKETKVGDTTASHATAKKTGQPTNTPQGEHNVLASKSVQQSTPAKNESTKQTIAVTDNILHTGQSTMEKDAKNRQFDPNKISLYSVAEQQKAVVGYNQHNKINDKKRNIKTGGLDAEGNQQNNMLTADSKTAKSMAGKFSSQQGNDKTSADQPVPDLTSYLYVPALELPDIAAFTIVPFISYYPLKIYDSLGKAERQALAAAAKRKSNLLHRFSLVAFGSPNHSFTRLENDQQLSGPGHDKKEAERSETQASSFSAGALVNYSLSKHVILQSGVVFSSATTNIAGKIIYAKPDNAGHNRYEFNCSSGYSYLTPKSGAAPATGDSIQVMGSSSTISYIGVPISINYVVKAGRFLLTPGAGFSVNFLNSGSAATNFGNSSFGSLKEKAPIDGLKTAYLDGFFGFGVEYMLSKRISLEMRPLMRLALTSINKDTPVRAYQNFSTLETGLKFNF